MTPESDRRVSKTWFTSATHFGHARVIALCRRPFADVVAMNEAIIAGWNALVHPSDVVWRLGDVAFGRDPERIDAVFARPIGIKHLVVGNHDEGRESVLTLPWASVSSIASTLVNGDHVAMCHYPMRTWPHARKGAIHLFEGVGTLGRAGARRARKPAPGRTPAARCCVSLGPTDVSPRTFDLVDDRCRGVVCAGLRRPRVEVRRGGRQLKPHDKPEMVQERAVILSRRR